MKNLLITLLLISCSSNNKIVYKDPMQFKNCIVTDKVAVRPYKIQLKLSSEIKKKYKEDYIWIYIPRYEYERFNVGDTIK